VSYGTNDNARFSRATGKRRRPRRQRGAVFSAFGIHLERSPEAREDHWRDIVSAVADFDDPLLAATQPPS
jgi:hypothetical protein